MPWTAADAKRHTKKANDAKKQRQWSHVANNILNRTGDEARAIRQANAVIAKEGVMRFTDYLKEQQQIAEDLANFNKLVLLAREGLVKQDDVNQLKITLRQMYSDKPLTPAQRETVISLLRQLIDLVTGDKQIFQKARSDIRSGLFGMLTMGESLEDRAAKIGKMVGLDDAEDVAYQELEKNAKRSDQEIAGVVKQRMMHR